MASALEHFDDDQYQKSFALYLQYTNEAMLMTEFIHNKLPDALASIGDGKSRLKVIGVGSGEGKNDIEMLTVLCLKHPGAQVDCEVAEPNNHMLQNFREMAEKRKSLDRVKFTWSQLTAGEFEEQWKQRKDQTKADFIHMLQVLYYVDDMEATIRFFRSLLCKNGKLLISLSSGESGWGKMIKALPGQLSSSASQHNSTNVRRILDACGILYQRHDLTALLDITKCFRDGDQEGGLLLDFMVQKQDFRQKASPELLDSVLKLLRNPEWSMEKDGKVFFKFHSEILLLDASD